MINNKELWFTRAKKLNDPYDCYVTQKLSAEYRDFMVDGINLNPIFEKIGICSLSTDPSIFTMWSYYNQHRGLCVGVKMDVVRKLFGLHLSPEGNKYVSIKQVIYQEAVAKINLYETMPPPNYQDNTDHDFDQAQNAINDFFAVKSREWEMEKEFRLILRESNFQETDEPTKERIPNLIDCVYIGCKNTFNPFQIIELAKKRKFNVYQRKSTRINSALIERYYTLFKRWIHNLIFIMLQSFDVFEPQLPLDFQPAPSVYR